MELRDYYLLAYGDNVVRIQDAKGTAVWRRGKWKWDKTDKTLHFLVMRAVRDLYHKICSPSTAIGTLRSRTTQD